MRKWFAVQTSDCCPHVISELVRWDWFIVVWLPWASLLVGCSISEGEESKHGACLPKRYLTVEEWRPHRGMSGDTVARRVTADTDSEQCGSLLVVRVPVSFVCEINNISWLWDRKYLLVVRSKIFFGCEITSIFWLWDQKYLLVVGSPVSLVVRLPISLVVRSPVSLGCEVINIFWFWDHQYLLVVRLPVSLGCEIISIFWLWGHQYLLVVRSPVSFGCEITNIFWLWDHQYLLVVKSSISFGCEITNIYHVSRPVLCVNLIANNGLTTNL